MAGMGFVSGSARGLIAAIVFLSSVTATEGADCTGTGHQYCTRYNPAHRDVGACPETCLRKVRGLQVRPRSGPNDVGLRHSGSTPPLPESWSKPASIPSEVEVSVDFCFPGNFFTMLTLTSRCLSRKNCEGRRPERLKSRGAERKGGKPTWEEIIDTGRPQGSLLLLSCLDAMSEVLAQVIALILQICMSMFTWMMSTYACPPAGITPGTHRARNGTTFLVIGTATG